MTKLIAGNWKMFKGPTETLAFFDGFTAPDGVDVVICPPYVSLEVAVGEEWPIYAQNVHWADDGAFTGEISASMLLELGVRGTLVGHSERRLYFGETDETVRLRADAALAAGLAVIACVGETEAERDAGATDEVLRRQVAALPVHDALVIAYEPVWAIGTGRTATAAQAGEAHAHIRKRLRQWFGGDAADACRVLYGGSVKPDNIRELIAEEDVDGALVGGASLDARSFGDIVTRSGRPAV